MERFLKSRYKIGEKISENPFSVTYQGSFLGTEKPVIIKIYKRGTLNSTLISRMKQKVKELSGATYHGIARLVDGDYGWQGFYYVREYIPGRSLKQILESKEKIGEEKAVVIAGEAAKALEFAHQKGIIHGALNLNNIIIDVKGLVKVTDFVIEGEIKEAMPQKALVILEKSSFLSPEELAGGPATASSDIYALGLVLHELLGGSVPSQPRYLQEILNKALQPDPLLRFSSAAELRESLEKKNLIFTPPAHEEYINIFDSTVTQYGGEEISSGSEALSDLGRVKIKWSLEKHRNWILGTILMLAFAAGLIYAFLFGR